MCWSWQNLSQLVSSWFIHMSQPNGHTTSNRRQFDVVIISIRWRPNFNEFPRHFHAIFRCNFADRKIHVVCTYFFWRNFTGQKVDVISTYFFGVILLVKKSTFFPSTFFYVISMVQKTTFVPLTFFGVILIVKKSKFLARSFFDKISMGKSSTSFLVKLQANENIRGSFPLLVTLKSWFLQECSPWT